MGQIVAKMAVLKGFWLKFLWRLIPSKLPIGVTELEAFSTSVIKTYGFPDLPSYRQTIATIIMHKGPLEISVKKHELYLAIRKAMSNQVAYEVIDKIREEAKIKAKMDAATELHRGEPVQDA